MHIMDYCSIFKHYHVICLILGINYFRIQGIPFQRTFIFPLKWNLLFGLFNICTITLQVFYLLRDKHSGGIYEIPLQIAAVSIFMYI